MLVAIRKKERKETITMDKKIVMQRRNNNKVTYRTFVLIKYGDKLKDFYTEEALASYPDNHALEKMIARVKEHAIDAKKRGFGIEYHINEEYGQEFRDIKFSNSYSADELSLLDIDKEFDIDSYVFMHDIIQASGRSRGIFYPAYSDSLKAAEEYIETSGMDSKLFITISYNCDALKRMEFIVGSFKYTFKDSNVVDLSKSEEKTVELPMQLKKFKVVTFPSPSFPHNYELYFDSLENARAWISDMQINEKVFPYHLYVQNREGEYSLFEHCFESPKEVGGYVVIGCADIFGLEEDKGTGAESREKAPEGPSDALEDFGTKEDLETLLEVMRGLRDDVNGELNDSCVAGVRLVSVRAVDAPGAANYFRRARKDIDERTGLVRLSEIETNELFDKEIGVVVPYLSLRAYLKTGEKGLFARQMEKAQREVMKDFEK